MSFELVGRAASRSRCRATTSRPVRRRGRRGGVPAVQPDARRSRPRRFLHRRSRGRRRAWLDASARSCSRSSAPCSRGGSCAGAIGLREAATTDDDPRLSDVARVAAMVPCLRSPRCWLLHRARLRRRATTAHRTVEPARDRRRVVLMFGAMILLLAIPRADRRSRCSDRARWGTWRSPARSPLLNAPQVRALYARFSVYDLSVLPMFMLMGASRLAAACRARSSAPPTPFVGQFRGGVAMAAVVACAASARSAAPRSRPPRPWAGRAARAAPLQLRAGSPPATLAAGGTLGILIPPSVVLVVYAIIVEENIVKLFTAAFIPGLLAVLFFIVTIAIYVRVVPSRAGGPAGRGRELLAATLGVVPVLRHLRRRHRRHLRRHLQPDGGRRDRRVPRRLRLAVRRLSRMTRSRPCWRRRAPAA